MRSLTATGQCKTKEDIHGLFRCLGLKESDAARICTYKSGRRRVKFSGGSIVFKPERRGRRVFTITAKGQAAVSRVHEGLTAACTAKPALLLEWRCQFKY